MTDKQKEILEKVKKLLALAANNPEANEAKSAMDMAGKLLAQYDLSMEMIEEGQRANRFSSEDVPVYIDRNAFWEGQLSMVVSEVFNCKVFRNAGVTTKYTWCFVGETHNVEICIWYLKYLRLQISKRTEEKYQKMKDRDAYALGIVHSVAVRLREMNRARREAMTENSKALALRAGKELDTYWKQIKQQLGLREHKHNRRLDDDAINQGMADGRKISLSRPVGGGSSSGGLQSLE